MSGLVASSNRFGNYFRNKGIVTNPSTPNQQIIRNIFGVFSTSWRLITQANRDAWSAYAAATPILKAGKTIYLTGQQMFIRCNTFRSYYGQTAVFDGPTTAGLTTFTAVTAVASLATGLTVTIDPTDGWANDNDGGLYGSLSDAQSASINFFKAPYRKGGGVTGTDSGPIPDTFIMSSTDGWALGKKVFVRVNATDADGRIGQAQELVTTIVA